MRPICSRSISTWLPPRGGSRPRGDDHQHTPIIDGATRDAEPMTFGLKLALWYADFCAKTSRAPRRARRAVAVGRSPCRRTFAHLDPSTRGGICRRGCSRPPGAVRAGDPGRCHAELMTRRITGASSRSSRSRFAACRKKKSAKSRSLSVGRGQKLSSDAAQAKSDRPL